MAVGAELVEPDVDPLPEVVGAVAVLEAGVPDDVADGAIQVEPEAGCTVEPEAVVSEDDAPVLSDSEDFSESLALIGIRDDARRSLLVCVD